MSQLNMFEPGMNSLITGDHRKQNSREAYNEKKPTITTDEDRVLEALHSLGKPSTFKEIAIQAGMEQHAVGRRLSKLCEGGFIIPEGEIGRCSLYKFVKFRK